MCISLVRKWRYLAFAECRNKNKILATPSLGEHRVSASNWSAKKSSSWSFTAAYWYPHFIYCYNGFYHSTTKSQTPFNLQNSCGLFTSAILPIAMEITLEESQRSWALAVGSTAIQVFFQCVNLGRPAKFFPQKNEVQPDLAILATKKFLGKETKALHRLWT